MRVIAPAGGKPVKIWASQLEPEAEQQVINLAKLPFIHSHVAVMPDAHAGKGSTVGTVIATRGAIIPAAVGVDIGCGMAAVNLNVPVEVFAGDAKLRALRDEIERVVPVGFHGNKVPDDLALNFFDQCRPPHLGASLTVKALNQCGSLGGGNHFIEVCADQNDNAWIVLHSGSRNVGKTLAELHIASAKGLMKQYFIGLPDPDLAYLVRDTPEFDAYIEALLWTQKYAYQNRQIMLGRVMRVAMDTVSFVGFAQMKTVPLQTIQCHHNYTGLENHHGENVYVTRKGAVSAREGEWGIIPGSMGTKSYIVKGKGSPDSFNSCSHGAGRAMSRTEARRRFTVADLEKQTAGVECRKDTDVIDEIPAAYKDIDQVMADQADLVDIVYTLKQIVCVKG